MSFGGFKLFNGVQDALVFVLMIVSMLALFYAPLDLTYKVGIAVIVFLVVFLSTLATQILRQQKELREKEIKQA
jgi:low affinity Fe/Cu permease